MAEQQEEYRGWLIQYDSEGFVASPVPNFDWPECVDPDEWELAQEASWTARPTRFARRRPTWTAGGTTAPPKRKRLGNALQDVGGSVGMVQGRRAS